MAGSVPTPDPQQAALVAWLREALEDFAGALLRQRPEEQADLDQILAAVQLERRAVGIVDVLDARYTSPHAELASLATALEVHGHGYRLPAPPDDIAPDVPVLAAVLRGQLIDELADDELLGPAAEALGDGIEVDVSNEVGMLQVGALCLLGREGARERLVAAQEIDRHARQLIDRELGLQPPAVPLIAVDADAVGAQMRRPAMPMCLRLLEREQNVLLVPEDRLELGAVVHEQLHLLEPASMRTKQQQRWWHQPTERRLDEVEGLDAKRELVRRVQLAVDGLTHLAGEAKVEHTTHALTGRLGPPDAVHDEQYRAYYSAVNDAAGFDADEASAFWRGLLTVDENQTARSVGARLLGVETPSRDSDAELVRWLESDAADPLRDVARIARLQNTGIETAAQLHTLLADAFADARRPQRPPLAPLDVAAPAPALGAGIRIPGIDP